MFSSVKWGKGRSPQFKAGLSGDFVALPFGLHGHLDLPQGRPGTSPRLPTIKRVLLCLLLKEFSRSGVAAEPAGRSAESNVGPRAEHQAWGSVTDYTERSRALEATLPRTTLLILQAPAGARRNSDPSPHAGRACLNGQGPRGDEDRATSCRPAVASTCFGRTADSAGAGSVS